MDGDVSDGTSSGEFGDAVRDPHLQLLASLIDEGILTRVSLTIAIGGALISGVLVSPREYYDQLMRAPSQGQGFDEYFQAMRSEVERAADSEPADPRSYGFLHLADVHILTGQGLTNPGMLWRVRIDNVAGWSYQGMS